MWLSHADESRAAAASPVDLITTGPVLLDMTTPAAEEAEGCCTVDARRVALRHSNCRFQASSKRRSAACMKLW